MVGAVVDVEFPPGQLPAILDALEVLDFNGENVEASLDVRLKGSKQKHSVRNKCFVHVVMLLTSHRCVWCLK